jgi:uncharacterized OsmC-like protein
MSPLDRVSALAALETMTLKVRVSASHDSRAALGWANGQSLTIDRSDGAGATFNARELLCLAVGGCYVDDLFQEAGKRGVAIRSVHVDVEADWSGTPARARDMTLVVRVESDADERTLMDLAEHTDRVAGIPNLLRLGTSVRVADARVIASGGQI